MQAHTDAHAHANTRIQIITVFCYYMYMYLYTLPIGLCPRARARYLKAENKYIIMSHFLSELILYSVRMYAQP